MKFELEGCGFFCSYHYLVSLINILAKRNITDERLALKEALANWGADGLDNGNKMYGSGSSLPDMGDLAMYGVMNSVNGSRTHDEMILGKGNDSDADEVVLDWYLRMQEQMR